MKTQIDVRAVPLIDLKAQYASIKADIDEAIRRVLGHTGFIMGAEVTDFEKAFAAYLGAAGAVGVASGTGALRLALHAVGVGPGDEVITTAHTFLATGETILTAGAVPVFVDIDPKTFNLDPALVKAAVTQKTRAIIPVHLYGQPAELNPILGLGLPVIEDAAQAHGAEYHGKRCGTIGDLSCFSFFPTKNLGAYGDGGAVTGNKPDLLARVARLRDHGRRSKHEQEEPGYGERLDALQAAILRAKLRHLEAWTEARRSRARRYSERLSGTPLGLPQESPNVRHVYHVYAVCAPEREKLIAHLKQRKIDTGVHYPIPLHRQPAYLKLGYGSIHLPHTEKAAAEILSLPMYPELTDAQMDAVVDAIREFYR